MLRYEARRCYFLGIFSFDAQATRVRDGELHYNMEKPTWDVRTLLEIFSREYSHKDYCLAHLFTDIKFEGGILGLAYVGSPRRNSVGGICTPGTARFRPDGLDFRVHRPAVCLPPPQQSTSRAASRCTSTRD